jgi:hypothetical protein
VDGWIAAKEKAGCRLSANGFKWVATYLAHQVLLTLRRQDLISESPRSGRQHKAWGVSPRFASGKAIEACEAGGSRIIWTSVKG